MSSRPQIATGARGIPTLDVPRERFSLRCGAGLIVSLVRQGETAGTDIFRQQGAWAQGLQFLGEGLLLSGISFLLGTILYGLRAGGGEVQHRLGLPVHTLKMPVIVNIESSTRLAVRASAAPSKNVFASLK